MPSICQLHNATSNYIQIITFEYLKFHVVKKTATFSKGNEYGINIYSLLEKRTACHFHNNPMSRMKFQVKKGISVHVKIFSDQCEGGFNFGANTLNSFQRETLFKFHF